MRKGQEKEIIPLIYLRSTSSFNCSVSSVPIFGELATGCRIDV